MAKVKIQGHATGSGIITIAAPNTNTNRTLTLPDADVTLGTPEGTAILSTGESGGTKFLREDGDGTCSWQAAGGGGGGAMEFISKSTVSSNVTAVDFTSLSGYNTYKLIFDCHTTSTVFLLVRIFDGGSLVTTNDAYDSRIRYNGQTTTGQSQVMWYIHRHDAAGNVFGELTFTVLSDRVNVRAKTGASSGSDVFVSDMTGSTDPTEDTISSFDGIRIYPHNNNITSGTFSLYGIKDS